MILRYSLVRHKHGIFKTMTELTVALFADLYAVGGQGTVSVAGVGLGGLSTDL